MSGQCEWCGRKSETYLCGRCLEGDGESAEEKEEPVRDKVPMKSYWMGQDVDTLPRETLMEIIHHLNRDLESARAATKSIIEINALARQARTR